MHQFASVAVVDPRGWVLMQERDSAAPVHPDTWALPGGTLEPGEGFAEGAGRELAEETGLHLDPGELRSLGRTRFHSEPCGGEDVYELFVAHADLTDADVSCGEGRQMVFVDPEALFDRSLHPAAAMQLPDLLDSADHRARHGGVLGRRFASVVLVAADGSVLMQERDDAPILDPGCWGLPGGHVQDGESFLDGAVRELAEETGVRLAADALTLVGEGRVDHTVEHGSHDRVRLFAAATTLGDDDVECGEGRQMVFVDPAAARELPLTRSAALLLPEFLDSGLHTSLRESLRTEGTGP